MANVDVIARIEASVDDGGWKASGAVFNDADRLDFYQRFKSWFWHYNQNGWEVSPRPAFSGYLMPDAWRRFFQASEAPFSGLSVQELMKRGEVQGIFFKHVASSPANRHQIINMTFAKIVYEIISGHCNLMHPDEAANYDSQLWGGAITTTTFPEGFVRLDIDLANSTSVTEWEVKQGNFWGRLKELAATEFYLLFVNKSNVLHYVPHPMFDATLPDPTLSLTSSLLLSPLTIARRNTETAGQVKLSGATPQGLQISGKYPDEPTAGPIVQRSGYVATSNSLMDTIAERMYKFENRDYTVTAEIGGAVGLMVELLDRVAITYTSSQDGISWSSKKFWIHRIAVDLMSNFKAKTTLVLEAENA